MKACGHCTNVRHRTALRRCARCRTVYYCSRACQLADWKESHRAQCLHQPDDPPAVHLDGLISDHEHQFHVMSLKAIAWDLAASLAALRVAPDASPKRNHYLNSLGVFLDCTVMPMKLRVIELQEHERDTTGRSSVLVSSVLFGRRTARMRTLLSNAELARHEAAAADIDILLGLIPVEHGGRKTSPVERRNVWYI
ncbi:hypothetical protein FA95DRAFT_1402910 [Auriscalpium vulgare]|uniref:Uncharacterized protein n=1 Tax=Auriscalpium vulgare TaxID=40419 RepID=A0ACB8RQ59_9AGAM|nr:hypothetical protein FA95DRAFT_1402910 [Auriscalpium vulgare]